MNEIMKNRVFGARGIVVNNSNLNSSFTGGPKTLGNGCFYNSDVSTKFLDREFYKNQKLKVFATREYKNNSEHIYLITLEDKIKELSSLCKNENELIGHLYSDYIDIQNYGTTIATKSLTMAITGAIQYCNGVNKISNRSNVIINEVLSPYSAAENKKNLKANGLEELGEYSGRGSNIGKDIFIDNAFYIQSFNVCPNNINNMVDIIKDDSFKGYEKNNFLKFKEATLKSSTNYQSRSRSGISDEFVIFFNVKENCDYCVADIGRYIDIAVGEDDKYTINLLKLSFINEVKYIDSIEIYYNSILCDIIHKFSDELLIKKDILLGGI